MNAVSSWLRHAILRDIARNERTKRDAELKAKMEKQDELLEELLKRSIEIVKKEKLTTDD